MNGLSTIVPSTESGGYQIVSVKVALVCLIGAVIVFPIALYVRLGTLRELLLSPAEVLADSYYLGGRSSLFGTYNHRETDEIIFEVKMCFGLCYIDEILVLTYSFLFFMSRR